MKHFVAFGNSDQQSFRRADVRECIDGLVVPGTTAAYYSDATVGFVLSTPLPYLIDPRTPLFQGRIDAPKASHYDLAARHGPSVAVLMGDPAERRPVQFTPEMFSKPVIQEMVHDIVEFQRDYGKKKTPRAQQAFVRYEALLAEAGMQLDDQVDDEREPVYTLLPYFVSAPERDPWWSVNMEIWQNAAAMTSASNLSAVVAVSMSSELAGALAAVPAALGGAIFFWLHKFNERRASHTELLEVWKTVEEHQARALINLYGGFFSICLGRAGLHGFSNGFGYSEARAWPELSSTGAAPARYYIRRLHQFAPPGIAQLIVTLEPRLACDCPVCSTRTQIVDFSYADLKRHFALSRKWEIDLVAKGSPRDTAADLRQALDLFAGVRDTAPPGSALPEALFLARWADVLESV